MSKLHRLFAPSLLLALAACSGPTASTAPTDQASAAPASPTETMGASTPVPASAAPTEIPAATQSPAASAPGPTDAPPVATGWTELAADGGPSAREDHTWTVAADGITAYLFGGRGADGASDELWQFDLVTNAWTQLQPSQPGPQARFGHTATWVDDVGLVVWSGQLGSGFFDDIWRYQPSLNSWEQLPSLGALPPARYGSCASLGPDGELWVSHGFTADSGRFADTRSYDFGTGTWTDRTPVDRVPVERCLHDCFWSANDQLVLYAGQTTGVSALGDVWAYDLATGAWTRGADPDAPARQLYALAATPSGGIVFGGGSLDGGYLNDTWTLDATTLALSRLDLPAQPPQRSGAALIADEGQGRILLFGGRNGDGHLADLWQLPAAELAL